MKESSAADFVADFVADLTDVTDVIRTDSQKPGFLQQYFVLAYRFAKKPGFLRSSA